MTLDAWKGINEITMFYLKAKRFTPEGLSTQEANINLPEEKKDQDKNGKKQDFRKKLGLPS